MQHPELFRCSRSLSEGIEEVMPKIAIEFPPDASTRLATHPR